MLTEEASTKWSCTKKLRPRSAKSQLVDDRRHKESKTVDNGPLQEHYDAQEDDVRGPNRLDYLLSVKFIHLAYRGSVFLKPSLNKAVHHMPELQGQKKVWESKIRTPFHAH
jgi:hypothetical protein